MRRLVALLAGVFVLQLGGPAFAADLCNPPRPAERGLAKGVPGGFDNPGCGQPDLNVFLQIIVNVIELLLQFAGAVAVIMILVGGTMYIISRGRPDLIERSYNTVKFGITGIVVVIIAYAIVYTVNFAIHNPNQLP